jgi:hypothetical protein
MRCGLRCVCSMPQLLLGMACHTVGCWWLPHFGRPRVPCQGSELNGIYVSACDPQELLSDGQWPILWDNGYHHSSLSVNYGNVTMVTTVT